MLQISDRISVRNIPLTEIQPVSLMQAYESWNALSKFCGALPQWPGIDFLFSVPASLLSTAMVLKLAANIEASEYLFWGSGLNWASGTDMTNKCPLDIKSPDIKQYIKLTLLPTIERNQPHYYETEFMGKAGFRFPENILRLPFVNKEKHIEYIVTFTFLSKRKEVAKHYQTA